MLCVLRCGWIAVPGYSYCDAQPVAQTLCWWFVIVLLLLLLLLVSRRLWTRAFADHRRGVGGAGLYLPTVAEVCGACRVVALEPVAARAINGLGILPLKQPVLCTLPHIFLNYAFALFEFMWWLALCRKLLLQRHFS